MKNIVIFKPQYDWILSLIAGLGSAVLLLLLLLADVDSFSRPGMLRVLLLMLTFSNLFSAYRLWRKHRPKNSPTSTN